MTQNPAADADEVVAPMSGPGDAELITDVRGGDLDAYGVLFARHVDAARRLARQLVSAGDVDDLVSEAFSKVLGVLQRGGGPDLSFRAYLLTSMRRLHVDRIRATARLTSTDDFEQYDEGVPFEDTTVAGFENAAAARAFASLPERWQQVLWHLEVEGQKPADIAPLLGMSANSVSALAYRAREGLRQAFVTMHANDVADETCSWVRANLGAYVRKGCSKRDAAKVDAHLEECRECSGIYLELVEVNSNLGAVLAPALLGTAGASYLAAAHVGLGGAKAGLLLLLGRARDWSLANPVGAVASGAAGVAAAAAVATGVTVGVHHQHQAHHHVIAAVAPAAETTPTPTPEPTATPTPAPSSSPSASPSSSPSASATPSSSASAPNVASAVSSAVSSVVSSVISLLPHPEVHVTLGDGSVGLDLTLGATSSGGYPLSVLHASAAHGTVSVASGHATYVPDPSWAGTDVVRYTLGDGHGGTVSSTVQVVTPPVLSAGGLTIYAGLGQPVVVDLANELTDPLHLDLGFQVGRATHGLVTVLGSLATYVPDLGFVGDDHFSYTASDASGHVATSVITVHIGPSSSSADD